MQETNCLRLKDVLPLFYWCRTRCETVGKLSGYLFSNVVPGVLVIAYQTCVMAAGGLGDRLYGYLVGWIAYLSLYELGYMSNDFLSLRREQQRGLNMDKAVPVSPCAGLVGGAVAARIFFAGLLLLHLSSRLPPSTLIEIAAILFGILLVFCFHNVLFYPHRLVTFFLLALGRGLLAVPLLVHGGRLSVVPVFVILAAAHALGYGILKGIIPARAGVLNASFAFRPMCAGGLLCAALFAVLAPSCTPLLLGLAVYAAALDFLFAVARFAMASARSLRRMKLRREVLHVHTAWSHDSSMTMQEIRVRAERYGMRKVYLAEHAENVDAARYLRMQSDAAGNRPSCEVVAGLEYEILDQHFLALGLREYVAVDTKDIASLRTLRLACQELIWAHPYFYLRKVATDVRYRTRLRAMMQNVDGLEWINLKADRPRKFVWRHVFLSFMAIWLYGRKTLVIGMDAHTAEDWDALPKSFHPGAVF